MGFFDWITGGSKDPKTKSHSSENYASAQELIEDQEDDDNYYENCDNCGDECKKEELVEFEDSEAICKKCIDEAYPR